MAPFNEAVKVQQTALDNSFPPADSGRKMVYEGTIDPTWNIGNVPCGGYALALVLEACIQHQASTSHVDPLHISAHFLKPTTSNLPFSVYVNTLKSGKGISNLTAALYQEDVLRITAHAMFGVNGPTPEDKYNLTLQAPSPYARRLPLYSHPSQAVKRPMRGAWNFSSCVSWSFDDELLEKNRPDHPKRTNSTTIGGGGLEWGAWFQFQTETETLSNIYIPFLVDMFNNSVVLLPKEERGSLGQCWFPTMVLSVDFKFPISKLSSLHSKRTVGLYSLGNFINNPQGRHDVYVEVWSAPSNIGEGTPHEDWREKQICLATATQVALTLPMEVNMKNGQKKLDTPKL